MDLVIHPDGTVKERILAADGSALQSTAQYRHPDNDWRLPFVYALRIQPNATGTDITSLLGAQTATTTRPMRATLGGDVDLFIGCGDGDGPYAAARASTGPVPNTGAALHTHAMHYYSAALTDGDMAAVQTFLLQWWRI